MNLVSLDDIKAARELLGEVVHHTPMQNSRLLSQRSGAPVRLKCENLQRTGSFKIRGAYVRLHHLPRERRLNGVVAASAGNHAQGVALAASLLGIRSTVFMPDRAPLPKVAATKAYGAEVRLHGVNLSESMEAAMAFASEVGAEFIHPFDHADIVAGQGTVGLEILEQFPEVQRVVVSTGGGGLVAGIAAAIKSTRPDVQIIAVQAEQAAAWPNSLAQGHPVRLSEAQTMADGIAVLEPGPVTYAHVRNLVDGVLTVSEEALSRALLSCLERSKQVVEPAGAAAVAGIMEYPEKFDVPTVAVLSGGNIDPLLLLHVIQHGMTAAGRYLALRARIPDRPGSLAALVGLVGDLGANVLDVEHSRISGALSIGEVDVELNLETRGPQHREHVVAELRGAGYPIMSEQ